METIIFNKRTLEYQTIYVPVEEEIKHTADSGNSTIIPLSRKWETLGIMVSGGLDSALLLYLTAKTIKNLNYDNLKILPIGFEVPSKLKSIEAINKIVDKVRSMLDAPFILPTKEFYVPLDQCTKEAIDAFDGKNKFMKESVLNLFEIGVLDFNLDGNTKNPPEDIRKDFHNNEFREKLRDNRISIYNAGTSASPHAFVDKADIVNLYIKENILDELAPLTVSCDQFIDKIVRLKMSAPCKKCWWCDERAYGFRANGVEDKAPPLPQLW